MKSDSIANLAKALSAAQGIMEGAKKDSENPFFKSNYADLASVWEAIRAPLSKNGLSVSQTTTYSGQTCVLQTLLMHESGEWICSITPILSKDQSPQAFGSGLSYARRYALAAIVGVYQADDDANEAQGNPFIQPMVSGTRQPVAPKVTVQANTSTTHPSEAQLKRLFTIAHSSYWSNEDVKAHIHSHYGITSSTKLTRTQYDELCKYIQSNPKLPEPGANG